MMKLEKSRQIVKSNIKSIASQSSIHGLPNIINTDYVLMKIIWLIVWLLALGYCSYSIIGLVIAYLKFEVLVNIRYSSDYDIDFPAVAICDFSPINRSVDDLVLSCSYATKPCNMSYFGKVLSNKYGQCNVFNSYVEGRPILKPNRAGVDYGLSLELYAGTPSKMPETVAITGLIVFTYNASSRPSFAEEAVRVRPGQDTSLMLSRVQKHKLSQPFSACIENSSDVFAFDSEEYRDVLRVSRAYRQKICLSLCSTKSINPPSLGKDTPEVVLINNMSYCLKKCPEECYLIEFKAFQFFSHYPNHQYAVELKKKHPILANLTIEEIKNSVVSLNVNYESLTTTIIDETPAMCFFTLLGNLGGQLGLFLGMSFLSFLEIFEMMYVVLWELCVRKMWDLKTRIKQEN